MGFVESFATLAMDRNEQERYERLKNSSNPEDRAEARNMIGDNDLISTYLTAMLKEQQKQKEKELKELEKKLEREKREKERKVEKEDEFDEEYGFY